jgi:N-acetylmuramoyl-L-alanine amidase-like protein
VARTRKSIPSPNYSSRGGATVRLIVLHTAEGARTIEELGNFFASSSSGVSSHVGIDDKAGVIGEYVKRPQKAWTAASANPVAVQAELCAFAAWTTAEWDKHPNMLSNTAKWIAEEAAYFSIPITKLTASQAQGSGRGVCQHNDLGSWGGGHWDCGSGFPMDRVLDMAKGGGDDQVTSLPAWFWNWSDWYLTTDRDPDARPDGAPATIPDWAWDQLDEIKTIGKRYGMTQGERDWVDWYLGGRDPAKRPNVPSTIPDNWWTDEAWVLEREHG